MFLRKKDLGKDGDDGLEDVFLPLISRICSVGGQGAFSMHLGELGKVTLNRPSFFVSVADALHRLMDRARDRKLVEGFEVGTR